MLRGKGYDSIGRETLFLSGGLNSVIRKGLYQASPERRLNREELNKTGTVPKKKVVGFPEGGSTT